jgi:hypothetical protein
MKVVVDINTQNAVISSCGETERSEILGQCYRGILNIEAIKYADVLYYNSFFLIARSLNRVQYQ